ncbi:alpha/beta hydrolase [uncultured Tateyamaria sp.]|uniref:alpha/beta fold hydrolase n=1 Tax=uncultured Tateyamaria sp. TaxID=455651 RepID=UPI002607782B|nr:alpha/beta hydrolase [uncultured Tateyamaria sp.]
MYIQLDTAQIFFDTVGAKLEPGPDSMQERATLLVLHGGPGFDHSTLRPYFDRFADDFQVIYVDHRGSGRSTGDPETWALDQWADDIAAFCDVLGIQSPVVFGQSFGGMVAMHYGARHLDGPSKLILSSTAAQFHLDETMKMMRQLGGDAAAEMARDFFSKPSQARFDAYAKICQPLYSQTDDPNAAGFRNRAIQRPEVAVHFFGHEMKDMDMRSEVASITCPTLVLGGALDPVTPPVCSQEIAQAVGDNATLEMFEGCGHGVHRDDPDGAERVMRAFLAGG